MAVWAFDRVLRFLRLARNGIRHAQITVLDDDYVRINVDGVASNGHAYLYFPTLTWRLWENHPFSVASTTHPTHNTKITGEEAFDLEKNNAHIASPRLSDSAETTSQLSSQMPHKTSMTFLLRTQSGLTRLLRSHGTSVPVLVESGYDFPTDLTEYPTLIVIAGGVGITAVLPLLRAHGGRTKLYWGARTAALVEDFAGPLAGIEKETFVGKRMSIPAVLEQEVRGEKEKIAVIVSGPHSMADEVRDVVCRLGRQENVAIKLIEESFSW